MKIPENHPGFFIKANFSGIIVLTISISDARRYAMFFGCQANFRPEYPKLYVLYLNAGRRS